MGTLRLRNCTIWDVHYWRQGGNSKAIAKPGEEGTYDWGATYTLGVKRVNIPSSLTDGKNYRSAVNQNGIYYAVWDEKKQKLEILSEKEANNYPSSDDNEYLSKWIKKLPDWMSALDGTHSLDNYSIPGTHDSGTQLTGKGPAHTQNFGIYTQLKDGIRFLDIRLNPSGSNKLEVKHGIVSCDINFENVLNDCKTFLKDHPGETILMLVNQSGSEYIGSRFKSYLEKDEYKNLFYINEDMPLLDEVRGKIVLFRRFEINYPGPMGIDLSKDWKDDKTFPLRTPQGVLFEIEDEYKQHDTHKKLQAVEDSLNKAIKNSNDGIMYITYNSISENSTLTHTPYEYAWGGIGIDPSMNPSLEAFLLEKPGNHRFGVVMLDFYNDKGSQNGIVEALVKSNNGLLKN